MRGPAESSARGRGEARALAATAARARVGGAILAIFLLALALSLLGRLDPAPPAILEYADAAGGTVSIIAAAREGVATPVRIVFSRRRARSDARGRIVEIENGPHLVLPPRSPVVLIDAALRMRSIDAEMPLALLLRLHRAPPTAGETFAHWFARTENVLAAGRLADRLRGFWK